MMVTEDEFIAVVEIDRETLAIWIESGWLAPQDNPPVRLFSDVDLARGRLVADLIGPMGVNVEGIDIILDLLDQIHGLRAVMRKLGQAVEAQPEDIQHRLRAATRHLRTRAEDL
jgi:chaperone modulatory protein CbpM